MANDLLIISLRFTPACRQTGITDYELLLMSVVISTRVETSLLRWFRKGSLHDSRDDFVSEI